MQEFRARCGACRTILAIPSSVRGETVRCPTCGKRLPNPATRQSAEPAEGPSDSNRPRPPQPSSPSAQPAPTEPGAKSAKLLEPSFASEPPRSAPPGGDTIVPVEQEIVPVEEEDEELEAVILDEEPEAVILDEGPAKRDATLFGVDLKQVEDFEDYNYEAQREPAVLPTHKKKGAKKKVEDEEEIPYWQQHSGLTDEQRHRPGIRFNSTAIGGTITVVFGMIVLLAGLKHNLLFVWAPIVVVAGLIAIYRGMFGD